MPEMMKAAVMTGVGRMSIEERPIPRVAAPDDALVRIDAVGICGSDLHWFIDGRIGEWVAEPPMVLGHEAAGTVVEVGEGVRGLAPGDRVAIEPGYPCRKCRSCKAGTYNLCPEVVFMAVPDVEGAFREYLTWPADFLHKLPENVTSEEGAMVEPLSVGLWAARRAGLQVGDVAAIVGAGPIGLATMQAAAASGATTLIISDVVPSRLALAERLGASRTVNAHAESMVRVVRELTGGEGADVCFECTGAAEMARESVAITRRGGTIQYIGMGPAVVDGFPIWDYISKELNSGGLFRYANCYPACIALVAAGRVDLQSLVTHRFGLEQVGEAMLWVHENKDKVIKAVIAPQS